MTEESKELTQMLLTTMVTNENMKWSFLPGATRGPRAGGDLESQYHEFVDSFTMVLLIWIMNLVFLVYWRRHQKPRSKPKVTFLKQEEEHEYHFEHESESISESEDEHSQEEEEASFLPATPTKPNMDSSNMEELPDILEEYAHHYDSWSPSKRHSLRLALKKHRGLGSGWEDSEHRYSLRVASHHHQHHDM